MATLYEGYTLCGVGPVQNSSNIGILGVEQGRDIDYVLVTDSSRSITVYKVSDQKPTGSWSVKQGQIISCPAVFNTQSQEYVVVTDDRVVRVWKEDDVNLEKAFKATVSADVLRVLSATDSEPVVLFCCGAVRFLDSLLASPQQPIEDVLTEDEIISSPTLLCIISDLNGSVYESVLPFRSSSTGAEGVQALSCSLCLSLPLGEEKLMSGAAVVLDEAHVAVIGFPHPSLLSSVDYLCIWNTHFQTLQASKEMAGRIYSQLWCYSGKLYVPHGKMLSVIPFDCQKSSLAAAMGKLKQTSRSGKDFSVEIWNICPLSKQEATAARNQNSMNGEKKKLGRNQAQSGASSPPASQTRLQVDPCCSKVRLCRGLIWFSGLVPMADLQLAAGRVALELVSRSQTDANFYPQCAFLQLLETRYLCYSVCPELLSLAMVKKDFHLCQIAFQIFSDIPEAVTCACLKAILSTPDLEMETVNLDTDSVIFMKELTQAHSRSDEEGGQLNGFCPPALESDVSDTPSNKLQRDPLSLDMSCPVGLHKGALLNEVLQTAYSDRSLLPHLKDLTVPQVIVFLQYLRFLYFKYSHDAHKQIRALRTPSISQIIDWVCLLLDAHFTVLAVAPEAKRLVFDLHKFVRSQVKLYAELGKIEGSLQVLKNSKQSEDFGMYAIQVIELF
uniref:Nucleolar protein 11 n=2 Tax=Cyprinus carpio TaxID=7962 RepID=A0A8C2HKG5_CYPCA